MAELSRIDLSPCTVLRAAGPDAFRFLNGQLTNDLALANGESTLAAAALNAKGGLDAVCWLRKSGDDYLLDAPLALRETLMARLDRYLIADELTLTDESDDWSLTHLLGESLPAELSTEVVTRSSRFGRPGYDVLSRGPVEIPGVRSLTAEEATALRVEAGIPAWRHELTPGLLPPEAGLDASMISYDKGCYLGQEVISRMKRAGKTNQHLVALEVPPGLTVPAELLHEGKPAGVVTSVSPRSENGRTRALGFRKRSCEEETELTLAEDGGKVRVLARHAP